MGIIPGVKVDYTLSPRIITIPVAGAPVDVSIADLQDTLQDIEDNEDGGILYPRLRDCSGGESLGGGRFVGYTMKLNDAQVMFEPQTAAQEDGAATDDDPSGTILTDSGATFIADGVERGSAVVNWTTRAMSVVTKVMSETQLRHVVLSGGSRATWLSGDDYRVYHIVKCSVSAGNITGRTAGGTDLDPIMPSPNVYAQKESATSAALVEGSGGATSAQVAAAVWDEPSAAHVGPGSTGRLVKDTYDVGIYTYNLEADVADLVDDLHDEALGRWVLNVVAKTLTLYRVDGSVLRVFNLTVAAKDVPPYVGRTPA